MAPGPPSRTFRGLPNGISNHQSTGSARNTQAPRRFGTESMGTIADISNAKADRNADG